MYVCMCRSEAWESIIIPLYARVKGKVDIMLLELLADDTEIRRARTVDLLSCVSHMPLS